MAVEAGKKVTLTDDEIMVIRAAITEELSKSCEIVREHLDGHHGGSHVGLADTRNWLGQIATLADVLDKIDPPGWREAIGVIPADPPVRR